MAKEEEGSANNDLGAVSFIFGMLSLSLFFTIAPAIIFGILGIVFGFLQRKNKKTKFALAGIILSIIGIISAICLVWFIFALLNQISELLKSCMQDPTLPECEDILQYLNQQQAGSQYGQ